MQKIDQEIWATSLGDQVVFLVSAANLQTADARSLVANVYHDMSFVADAAT